MKSTILVSGVTGTVGQEVVKALLKKDVKIRVGARDLAKIKNAAWFNKVAAVELDYSQPKTLEKAFKGVNKLFLLTPPVCFQEKEIAEIVLKEAKKQGIKHIVRLSGINANKHNLFANHAAADKILLASDIAYTALQPNTFMQNFCNYSDSIKMQSEIVEPAAFGKTSFVDARDIAAVAAAVLTEAGHENKVYEITGGEALDYAQVAEIFSAVLGRKIQYRPLEAEAYIKLQEAKGIPNEFCKRLVQNFQWVAKGENARVSSAVQKILGRPPISLKQFVTDYRDKFFMPPTLE